MLPHLASSVAITFTRTSGRGHCISHTVSRPNWQITVYIRKLLQAARFNSCISTSPLISSATLQVHISNAFSINIPYRLHFHFHLHCPRIQLGENAAFCRPPCSSAVMERPLRPTQRDSPTLIILRPQRPCTTKKNTWWITFALLQRIEQGGSLSDWALRALSESPLYVSYRDPAVVQSAVNKPS